MRAYDNRNKKVPTRRREKHRQADGALAQGRLQELTARHLAQEVPRLKSEEKHSDTDAGKKNNACAQRENYSSIARLSVSFRSGEEMRRESRNILKKPAKTEANELDSRN